MEENLNIFGKNLGEIGSLDKNLVLRTKGQVYIRFGRKYIELLDNKGNLNVKIPKFIFKVNSESEMKSNGIYLLDDNVYVYYDGDIILLTGTESEFVSYAIELNLTQELIDIALKNIGLKFTSVKEALKYIENGIFFVEDKIYYTIHGEYIELGLTLNYPLKDINEANLPRYPSDNNLAIVYINGRWVYSSIVTKEEFNSLEEGIELNTPLKEINEALTLRTLPEVPFTEPPAEGEETPTPTEGEETPTPTEPLDEEECSCESDNFSYAIVYKNEKQWAYERIVPYEEFSKCCKMILEKLEELEEATKKYTVTWLNKDGSVYATTTVTKGNTAVSPGNPTLKHWRFLEWLYDNSPIEEDIEILSKWKYIPPIVHLKCEPSIIGSEGGEVIVSYWVEWDGDIILNDITVEGIVDKINYIIEENYYIEDDKIKRKITVSESNYSTLGKIFFTASFMGEEGEEEGMGLVKTETTLLQHPAGALLLPEFDLMKFTTEWTNTTTEDMTDVEGWTNIDGVWTYYGSGDLDIYTHTEGTNIPITETKTLDKYGVGFAGDKSMSLISVSRIIPIIVRKNATKIYDSDYNEITKETIEAYNLSQDPPKNADMGKDVYDLFLYLAWSGDNTSSGGEYTVLNFKKILNNVVRKGQKAIFVYMQTIWALSYNGTGKFDIAYDIYTLDNEEKGLVSPKNEFDFNEEEDSTVRKIEVLNNKLTGLYRAQRTPEESYIGLSDYGNPIATLYYDFETTQITFIQGYYTEEDIYGSSSTGDSFTWLPINLEEQNDNN